MTKVKNGLSSSQLQSQVTCLSKELLAAYKKIDVLQKSNEDLESFAHIACHDLKSPLRGLVSNTTILREDGGHLEPSIQSRLDRILYLSQRMTRVVDDLLNFSLLGRQEFAIRRTDIANVVRDVENMLDPALAKNARIFIATPMPLVVCDLPRMTEVLRNLITNALKYNHSEKKHVEIGCIENEGEPPIFYVRDNGIGIAQQHHDVIFTIFKRLNEEDDSVRGSGIGLTFVKKVIERHGGRIWVQSKLGEGATFYFTLSPAKQAKEEAHAV